ncbi:MAG: FAD-dependent oxidoreductase [Microcella pacifica]
MSITRRTLITGATGLSVLAVAACTQEPGPRPEPSAPSTAGPSRPTGMVRSAWSTEPFSRGATSFLPIGGEPADRARLSVPVADRLFFAGEATSVDSPNSVEGARASGERAAGEVLRTALLGERIAVIGAGVAGAACAHRLNAAGHDVVVVEARERLGGRVQTVRGGEWPVSVELGALRIGRNQPSAVRDALEELGLSVLDGTTIVRREASGDEIEVDGMREAVLARAREVASEVDFDIPLSTASRPPGAPRHGFCRERAQRDGGGRSSGRRAGRCAVRGAGAPDLGRPRPRRGTRWLGVHCLRRVRQLYREPARGHRHAAGERRGGRDL